MVIKKTKDKTDKSEIPPTVLLENKQEGNGSNGNDKDIERLEDDIEELEETDKELEKALLEQTKETISLKEEVKFLKEEVKSTRLEHKKQSDFWNKIIGISSVVGWIISAVGIGINWEKKN